jgi:hypothetical protein
LTSEEGLCCMQFVILFQLTNSVEQNSIGKVAVTYLRKKFPFMEAEGSLPRRQETATCLHPELDELVPCIILLRKIYFQSTLMNAVYSV